MQNTSHTETVRLMPFSAFSLFVGLRLGVGLSVAEFENTITSIIIIHPTVPNWLPN